MAVEPVNWRDGAVVLLDQTLLPREERYHSYRDPADVAEAIRKMIVRGAPAIGVTAALGLALAAQNSKSESLTKAREDFERWCRRFAETRPTAVNLFWAIERMKTTSAATYPDTQAWAERLLRTALGIREEDLEACRSIGRHGNALIPDTARVLTHCNAGALATAGWGTALGVVRTAVDAGKKIAVIADETRPFLQGSRLTAWELAKDQIPVTLIADNMAGYLMSKKEVDLVIVGADRIAANGDTANKIGTYSVAVLAKENQIPFYVAAPLSTIDRACPTGEKIPIEERDPKEVTSFAGVLVAPEGVQARHPAFDVTPARLIAAIVTEKGIARAPYTDSIRALFER